MFSYFELYDIGLRGVSFKRFKYELYIIIIMTAKFGFVVSLIAGILIILASILVLLFPISPTQSLALRYYTGQSIYQPPLFVTIIALITGLIILYGSTQMRKEGHEKTAAKLVLLFSIINLVIISVGSILSVAGSILGIIGGILAFMKK